MSLFSLLGVVREGVGMLSTETESAKEMEWSNLSALVLKNSGHVNAYIVITHLYLLIKQKWLHQLVWLLPRLTEVALFKNK